MERYEYARKLKNAQTALNFAGLKLGALEMEKRIAIESESYDKAKQKNRQKEDYRNEVYDHLDVQTLLETKGVSS